ncbi:MAG: fibronectin type III domain-containing protein [Acidobacteriota bacterium]
MTRTRAAALLAALLWLAGCSQSAHPTSPSPLTPRPAGLFSQAAIPSVVDWSAVTGVRDSATSSASPDAPGAPTGLTVSVSGSTVTLTWMAPASGNATSYVLEAGTGTGLSDVANFNTGSAATTFTTTGVPNGTYFVRVRGRNADGTGAASNEITVVVGACAAPSAPTGFTATASGATVTLSWAAVAGATSYLIEAGRSSGATDVTTFDTGSTATTFSGTAPAGTYFLRVRARSACGLSPPSTEAIVMVTGAPPPAGGLSGLWRGTMVVRETSGTQANQIEVDFVHVGTRLTGTARDGTSRPPSTFDLTQQASGSVYQGTLTTNSPGCQIATGSLVALTPTRLTGTFTVPCGSMDFDLTKIF